MMTAIDMRGSRRIRAASLVVRASRALDRVAPHLRVCVAMGVAATCLSGCAELDARRAPPVAMVDTVHPIGNSQVRSWGEEVSPEVATAVAEQYREVRRAASADGRRETLLHADFLVISGGGSDGAYAAALLKGWTERGTRPEFEVVTGVSTGALAAPFAFLGYAYDDVLAEIYETHGDADLYTSNGPFGLIGPALEDTAPLKRLIEHYVSDAVIDAISAQGRNGRRLLVQATNIDAQRPVVWDLTAIASSGRVDRRDLLVTVLLASSAIPAVFPPQRIAVSGDDGQVYDELHVDGGTTAQIFFTPPELRLGDYERAGFGHGRTRTLFAIRNGKIGPEYEVTEEATVPLATRAIATLVKGQTLAELEALDRTAHDHRALFLYSAVPQSFHATKTGTFDPAYMTKLYEAGRAAGRADLWAGGGILAKL